MWVCLLFIAMCFWYGMYGFKRRRMYRMASLFPGERNELPLLGSTHRFFGNSEAIMEQIKDLSYQAIANGGIVRMWFCHVLIFAITDPIDLEFILKTCLDKSDLHKFSRQIIGNGGIFAPVPIWRRRRKVMVPTFSPKVVESFVKVFSEQSQKVVGILQERAQSAKESMWPFLSSYTLDSVCETTMGVKINAQENPETPFLVWMTRLLDLLCQRYFHVWLHPDWLFRLFPQYREQEFYKKEAYSFFNEIIRNKIQEIENNKESKADYANEGTQKGTTFLDQLIHLSRSHGEEFSELELREELMTLATAGTDTSAVATGFAMLLLAKYPRLQERVYEEIYGVFGESDRLLVKKDLTKLKYLECFVKETLRLFPPVPMILRQLKRDVTLPSGRVLPEGSTAFVSIWGVHRDPQYWGPNVKEFDPDRFSPERFKLPYACNFMPFSQGPRNCLGYQYAIMSIKTVLSAILRTYRIVGEVEDSPIPKIRVKLDIMMKALDNYTVALEKRKRD